MQGGFQEISLSWIFTVKQLQKLKFSSEAAFHTSELMLKLQLISENNKSLPASQISGQCISLRYSAESRATLETAGKTRTPALRNRKML